MPGRDRTGPMGQGPLTGREFGSCGRGLAFRRGLNRGFGWRVWNRPPYQMKQPTKEEEKQILKEELNELKKEENTIKKRLEDLEIQ